MPSEKHQQKAREALSVRTLTPTQMEDCIPSVAAALEATERETAQRCAEIADENAEGDGDCAGVAECVAVDIRAEFGITEKEATR